MTNLLALKAPLASPTLTGNPTAPTPAQFDNDTSIATTAFVQRALGNFSGMGSLSANTTLVAADVGKNIEVANATTAFTVTLPVADGTIADGGVFHFHNDNVVAVTIARQGTDQIHVGNGLTNSFVLQRGDDVSLIKGSTGYWHCIGGTVKARYSDGDYGKSLVANGYQKLPSGLIIQWGRATVDVNGSTITLPIAFPNSHIRTFSQYGDCQPVGSVESLTGPGIVGQRTLTNFVGKYQLSSGANTATSFLDWIAVGY
jgi:hypothetical protein